MIKSEFMRSLNKVVLMVLLVALVVNNGFALQPIRSKDPVYFIGIDANISDRMMLLAKVALKGISDQETVSTGKGLQVYNTATISGAEGVSPGYYLWNGIRWVKMPYQPGRSGVKTDDNEHTTHQAVDSVKFASQSEGNTVYGVNSLRRATIGSPNTVVGNSALSDNVTGSQNTAIGYYALRTNVAGSQNVGVGQGTLFSNTNGSRNTAIGTNVLFGNTVGINNTALGHAAFTANSTGVNNTALGQAALQNSTGSNNTAVGQGADVLKMIGNNCIAIGYAATTGDNSDYVQIGNAEVNCIGGEVSWSTRSDKRIKQGVNEAVPGLDFVVKLQPINYQLNLDIQDSITGTIADTSAIGVAARKKAEALIRTGFAAQDVEELLKELGYSCNVVVKPQNANDLYSLSYELLTVPLVKAVQEQQKQIKGQQVDIEMLKRLIQYQQQQIEELKKTMQALLKKSKMTN